MILAVKGIETDERFHAHPYNKKASAGTRSCAIGYATRLHNGLCTKADDAKYRHGSPDREPKACSCTTCEAPAAPSPTTFTSDSAPSSKRD